MTSPPVSWRHPRNGADAVEGATELFRQTFDYSPAGVWMAPGRANLIGEHVDYNGGLCMPYALPHAVVVAASPRADSAIRCTSAAVGESWLGAIDHLAPGQAHGWPSYVAGAVWSLTDAGCPLNGLDLAIESTVPLGAGLSSSAALICAVALAALATSGYPDLDSSGNRKVLLAATIRAETEFVGAPTGGMDQTASLLSVAGHALLIDFRSGSVEPVPLDPAADDLALLVIDTGSAHSNADGQYGLRRAECEQAARLLGVQTLRDVTDLASALERLPVGPMRRRVRHVVTEIARVEQTAMLLRAGALGQVGPLFTATHQSLRDDFEVSAPALEVAVAAVDDAGALGSRLVGGGFGGSVLALVPAAAVEQIATTVGSAFARAGLPPPQFLAAPPAAGARRLA